MKHEKLEEMLKNMKEQTFGTEVECYNIDREYAAKVVAEFFGTNRTEYEGGTYNTWIAYDAQGRKWKMERDSSIIARIDDEKCELVTPILKYEDMDLLQGVIRKLREAGARSNPSHSCGVHVHVGAKGHTPATLRNLVNIMASHESILIKALAIDNDRICRWCKPISKRFLEEINKRKPDTMEKLSDCWYISNNADYRRMDHYNPSRYHILNLHAVFTKGTIEFRMFQFDEPADGKWNGLHAGQLKAYIQLCLAISNYAKTVRNAKPEVAAADAENPKYVMRAWLNAIGMAGEEFKTARNLYMGRLEGNSDCRAGDRALCNHRVA